MHNEFIDKFFFYASRMVIIFSIVVVAFFLLFAQNPFKTTQRVVLPTPTPIEAEDKKVSFDLYANYICKIDTKESSTAVYIKNKSARVIAQEKGITTNTLFSKDCLYTWQSTNGAGQKTCGLSQYVSIFETLGQFGLSSPDSLLQSILGEKTASGASSAISFDKVCQKQEVKEDSLFVVPKSVKFVEKKAVGK